MLVSYNDHRKILGCVAVTSVEGCCDVVELRRMRVDPCMRGGKLAQELLDKAESFARSNGAKTMRLNTSVGLEAARKFYLNNGFRVTRVWARHRWIGLLPGINWEVVDMEKQLH